MNLLEYYIGDDPYTSLLQLIIIILSIVILRYVYVENKNIKSLKNDIKKLDKECPKCPDCPACNCKPGLTKCPDCVCPDKNSDITSNTGPNFPMNNGVSCPEVKCPEVTCPSVDQIVDGMFPGRNKGITATGKYVDINANEEGTLLSAYSNYSNLRNDGEDMRMLNSEDLPDDTLDKMNMGNSMETPSPPSSPPSAPLSTVTSEPISSGGGVFSSESNSQDSMNLGSTNDSS